MAEEVYGEAPKPPLWASQGDARSHAKNDEVAGAKARLIPVASFIPKPPAWDVYACGPTRYAIAFSSD